MDPIKTTSMLDLLDAVIHNPTEAIANSFKDFHAKGLDYICLKRSENYTLKLYLFDGDASKLPEVVNPHDHRYTFRTTVLHGYLIDYRYEQDARGQVYNAFDYMTPLNGGNGFTYKGERRLLQTERNKLPAGSQLISKPNMVHTIRTVADQTMLMLEQYADEIPIDMPTTTWVRWGDPKPDTSGLYSRFTEAEMRACIGHIRSLMPVSAMDAVFNF